MSKNFSDNFRSMRKQRGLTQEQVAEKVDIGIKNRTVIEFRIALFYLPQQ